MDNHLKKIHLLSISYKDAAVHIREKFSLSLEDAKLFYSLKDNYSIDECYILSTCNRTEFYAVINDIESFKNFIISGYKNLSKQIEIENLRHLSSINTVKHLMKVSAGMDSMILGETQITSQIKSSFKNSREHSATGPILNKLLQFCLEGGKRVRRNTKISNGAISVSFAAVEKIQTIYKDFTDINILLVGAGNTGKLTAHHFVDKGATNFYIANRNQERGLKLANEINGQYIEFNQISNFLEKVQVVVTCTGATFPVISQHQLDKINSVNHRLLLMDLSVPRNIHANVEALDNISLFVVDELESVVSERIFARQKELPKAEKIIDSLYNEFFKWLKTLTVTPTISELKNLFNEIKNEQLLEVENKYDTETLKAIDLFSTSLMKKILKKPISTLKIQTENDSYSPVFIDAIRSMYNLDKEIEHVESD